MTPEQEAHLLSTVTKTGVKMDALISDDHQDGLVPEAQRDIKKHSDKINNFDGSFKVIVWILGFIILGTITLGGVLAEHLLGGK